ncbi:MAG TPA: hypothetical protein VJ860_08580 [Polyangia bacterium]|jgi:hypothetical protein|nr:hypothetical protein [Polyangia bacterium]
MTATGSKISRDLVLSWPPVCPAHDSPSAFTAASTIRTLLATGHSPAISSDILQETAASPARSRSSRTTLY